MNPRSIAGACAALIAVCLLFSPCIKADMGSGSDYSPAETIGKTNVLEVDGQLLSAYQNMKYKRSSGSGFYQFGRIGYAPDRGYTIEGDAINYSFGFKQNDLQVQYFKQFYNVRIYTPHGLTTTRHNSAIYKISYSPESLNPSARGRFSLGGMVYLDGHNRFTQPFVMASTGSDRARATLGVNWLTGDVPHSGAAAFGAVQLAVTPGIGLFADYNAADFQKTIINNFLLSSAGINCSACSKDAFSAGVSLNFKRGFRMSQRGAPVKTVISGSFGVYDVQDLKAPFGNLLINMDL